MAPSDPSQAEHGDAVGTKGLLTVVVPCYNESEVVGLFYRELKPALDSLPGLDHEIILVDDGSTDDTLPVLNELARSDPAVRVCSLSRNFGHQIALTAGIDFAEGDAVVLMDADLQHPPEKIAELVGKWREGYDVVSAVRTNTQGASWLKDFNSKSFQLILNFLSTTHIPQGVADFNLMSRRVYSSIRQMPERHRFLRGLVSWAGFSHALVPYECGKRAAGRSKYTFTKMVGLALDAVFSFSSQPLRLALRLGTVMAVLGFVYLFWTVANGLIRGGLVPGYASLIGVTITLGGCQLIFIGLIGHYLSRVFEEVKGRPIYLLKQEPHKPTVAPKSPP
jgi:dolichol-phosphate mannosyltransferase